MKKIAVIVVVALLIIGCVVYKTTVLGVSDTITNKIVQETPSEVLVNVIWNVWENPTACGGDESDNESSEGWWNIGKFFKK